MKGGENPTTLRPYEAIHEHAELELELAGRGEVDRVVALGERWDELTRDLPARPPASALPLLQQARLLHERTRVELIRVRGSLLSELSSASRARRAVNGYAGQPTRRPHLDHNA